MPHELAFDSLRPAEQLSSCDQEALLQVAGHWHFDLMRIGQLARRRGGVGVVDAVVPDVLLPVVVASRHDRGVVVWPLPRVPAVTASNVPVQNYPRAESA